ncbi:MAG: TRAP transporter substrate-binding protein [Hyphomicrobiales bacterium]|nr:TRAP transporter substrate-binding protein [Hyphomicrobiales bacterium]
MNRMIRWATAGALTLGLSFPAFSQTKWDMPTPYGETNFHTQNIIKFAEDVKAATNGELTIAVHSGGSLIKHPEIKNAVRSGQVAIGEFLLSTLANENPVFGIDSVPFLANSYDAAAKLWNASRERTEDALAKQGLTILFAVPWPPQGVYAKKELNTIQDLKGVKFRAYNAATERLAQLAGAVPTQIEVPDIPQGFATGRVDAMITSPSTGVNSKVWDFLSHYYDTQAWLPKNIVVVNKDAFASLDGATRNALLDAAKAAETRGWKASKQETATQTKTLADNGLNVAKPSEALAASMREIGETMTQEWLKNAGADGEAVIDGYKAM